ncbi:transcriptional regulator [Lacrimispora sp. 38-1]|uniref:transcriptional regulator n=1 Tax=Lacrimispora sp. 38-1 TaxID=3125778 RepID=UPI003CE8FF5C
MENENTAIRLKKIMTDRNLRQTDILNLAIPFCNMYNVKMNKSDISQYCSGKTEPNQKKLFVLGKALNVSEAWLMGFDVPMERVQTSGPNKHDILIHSFDDELFNNYIKLNNVNKRKVIDYSKSLYQVQLMEEENSRHLLTNAAHQRTDIEVTEEMKEYDNAFFDE